MADKRACVLALIPLGMLTLAALVFVGINDLGFGDVFPVFTLMACTFATDSVFLYRSFSEKVPLKRFLLWVGAPAGASLILCAGFLALVLLRGVTPELLALSWRSLKTLYPVTALVVAGVNLPVIGVWVDFLSRAERLGG